MCNLLATGVAPALQSMATLSWQQEVQARQLREQNGALKVRAREEPGTGRGEGCMVVCSVSEKQHSCSILCLTYPCLQALINDAHNRAAQQQQLEAARRAQSTTPQRSLEGAAADGAGSSCPTSPTTSFAAGLPPPQQPRTPSRIFQHDLHDAVVAELMALATGSAPRDSGDSAPRESEEYSGGPAPLLLQGSSLFDNPPAAAHPALAEMQGLSLNDAPASGLHKLISLLDSPDGVVGSTGVHCELISLVEPELPGFGEVPGGLLPMDAAHEGRMQLPPARRRMGDEAPSGPATAAGGVTWGTVGPGGRMGEAPSGPPEAKGGMTPGAAGGLGGSPNEARESLL